MIDAKLLKVGGYYRTRVGLKVHLLAYHPQQDHCWIGEILQGDQWIPHNFSRDGDFYTGRQKSSLDILTVWKEPLDFDWSAIPDWCDAIVFKEYDDYNTITDYCWLMESSITGYCYRMPIPISMHPKNWTDDMGFRFKRPKKARTSDD